MARFELQIQGDSSNFVFDVEGEWTWEQRKEFHEQRNPPELRAIREVWRFRQARIRSSDGTVATLWDELLAFRARLATRGTAYPTFARLVRKGSPDVVELTLGPNDYEQFRIDLVQGETDAEVPAASWVTVAPITLEISAVRKFADADGIVGYDQTVQVEYVNGLRRLTWRTRVETVQGTSAVTKAQGFARIPLAGTNSTYETDGPHGLIYEYEGDERSASTGSGAHASAHTPTVVIATCVLRTFGVSVSAGSGPAGLSPGDVSYSVTIEITKDERIVTTQAAAKGPGHLDWVKGKRPEGTLTRDVLFTELALNESSGLWEQRETAPGRAADDQLWTITAELTGGHQAKRYRPVSGGLPAVRQIGGVLPFRLAMHVVVEKRGGTGLPSELPFPPVLGQPWDLDLAASTETEPVLAEKSPDPGADRWRREARLVYWSVKKPPQLPALALARQGGAPRASYLTDLSGS